MAAFRANGGCPTEVPKVEVSGSNTLIFTLSVTKVDKVAGFTWEPQALSRV